jgi:predicted phage terminase large subunit-like protein
MSIIAASYGHELAADHARATRTIMESPFYRELFPNVQLTVARELHLQTSLRGLRRATSLGGSLTGLGADVLIVDDLMKAADAQSPAERASARNWFENTLVSRIDKKATGSIVAIQQRLHEDDIAAYLIGKGTYEHLNLQAIAERDEEIPIGPGRVHRRAQGEPLFPQHEPLDALDELRRELGPVVFSAQYQQNPTAPGGNLIRWDHWGTYDKLPALQEFQYRAQSWDTGMSGDPNSDPSVCTTWGYLDGRWYLVDVFRARLDYSELKREVIRRARAGLADKVIIELAANGLPLVRELVHEENLGDRIHRYRPRFDKLVRLNSQAAKLETGKFLLPRSAPWLDTFRQECLSAPNGKHDDQVDSLSQFLDWTSGRFALSQIRDIDRVQRNAVTHKPASAGSPGPLVRSTLEARRRSAQQVHFDRPLRAFDRYGDPIDSSDPADLTPQDEVVRFDDIVGPRRRRE